MSQRAFSTRGFVRIAGWIAGSALASVTAGAAEHTWIQSARVFLIDAYQPPFAPRLEFDADALVQTMTEMHANTVRIATMGKFATIQGTRFTRHPELGQRDVLAETIAAAKPRGIRVVAYISTGHKLAWSMVTADYPEYAQRTRPGGGPARSHMFVGEDHGTVCWNTPYREAYLDYVEHVVRDYDVDGLYFDTWRPFYFWPGLKLCYCNGCRDGFRAASGRELPWREQESTYTRAERETIDRYHQWYRERFAALVQEVRSRVKARKDIPLIYNLNNPRIIAAEDPRILAAMDAFLYERGASLLERAEGVSLARAAGFGVWPYVGVYHNWPRVVPNGIDYQQEVFATVAFGGAPIIAQPTGYLTHAENRRWVAFPFSVIAQHEPDLQGFENVPYAAVVYGDRDPPGHAAKGQFGNADVRSATLGAFAACLNGHVQVSSIHESLLDQPDRLQRYRVVYLADLPHLTPRRVENLLAFVEGGGGLVASRATSLYDGDGRRRDGFALEKLLCVRPITPTGELAGVLESYRSMLGGPNDLYLAGRAADDDTLVPLSFFEPVEALPGGVVARDIVVGDGRRPILPGLVTSRHGSGHVAYLASALDSLYHATSHAGLGRLLRKVVRDAAAGPPPFEVTAPALLVTNLTQKGDRYVLHLLNWTANPQNEDGYLPPVSNVTVRWTVPAGRKVRTVSTMIDAAHTHEVTAGQLIVRLPRVDAYQGIAITVE